MSKITKMPNTTTITFGGLTLQCRMSGRAILKAEKRLDESVMGLFIKKEGEMKLPPSNSLLIILHESNVTSGIKESDIVNAFYDHIDEGGTALEIFEKVSEMLNDSGFFGKDKGNQEDEVTLDKEPTVDSVL